MSDLVIKVVEGFCADYMPDEHPWEAFALVLILDRLFEIHARGRMATASELSRACRMPRQTLRRKLETLETHGFIERRGSRYVLSAQRLNDPVMIQGFRRRVMVVKRAPGKLAESAN